MKIVTLGRVLLSYVIHALGRLIPRRKDLWVVTGWHRNPERDLFADNAKYFFLEASREPSLRVVWLAESPLLASLLRNRGFEAYSEGSMRGILLALRAGTTVVDAFPRRTTWRYSNGSRLVQLWHGKGFKEVAPVPSFAMPEATARYAYSIASSLYTADLMAASMPVERSNVLVTGLPRTDVLFSEVDDADIDANPDLEALFARTDGLKRILYAPTFRRWDHDPLEAFDPKAMDEFAQAHGLVFFLSLHPKYHSRAHELRYERVVFVSGGYDLYPHLKRFDALITDYSSLFADYLLLDRPILFFAHDLDRYRGAGNFAVSYEDHTPGHICKDSSELKLAIEDAFSKDSSKERRRTLCKQYHTHVDGNSSRRVIDALLR